MLRHPVTAVAEPLGVLSQCKTGAQRLSRVAALDDRRKIKNGKLSHQQNIGRETLLPKGGAFRYQAAMDSLEDARTLDAADPLRPYRNRFSLPKGVIYLDGNSLGALPKATPERLRVSATQEWGEGLIRSWNDADWIGASARIGSKIAPLVGAKPNEVIVADSTSVNLFKLLAAGLDARPGRSAILYQAGDFPTDGYMVEGLATLRPGVEARAVPGEALIDAIDGSVAVVLVSHVHYKTADRWDMAAVTARAHAAGALIVWDLSHAVGAVEVDLNGCDATWRWAAVTSFSMAVPARRPSFSSPNGCTAL